MKKAIKSLSTAGLKYLLIYFTILDGRFQLRQRSQRPPSVQIVHLFQSIWLVAVLHLFNHDASLL